MEKKTPTNNIIDSPYSIRTMAQDLAQANKEMWLSKKKEPEKKSVQPEIKKELEVKKTAPPMDLPIAEPAPKPIDRTKLAGLEQDKPKAEAERAEKAAQPKISPQSATDKSELKIEPELKKASFKNFLLVFVPILIIGLGGFFYWYNYLRPVAPVQPAVTHFECLDNQCVSIEGEGLDECASDADCDDKPKPLLAVETTEVINLNGSLKSQLQTILKQDQPEDNLKQILVSAESDYLALDALAEQLGIRFPVSIMGAINTSTDSYTLFAYGEDPENRLGIVIKTRQSSSLRQDLRDWEPEMKNDLTAFLMQDQVPASFSQEFLDNLYQEAAIRYMNFPTSDLSIDYALLDDKLIITTSKKSMFKAIQALKEQAQE